MSLRSPCAIWTSPQSDQSGDEAAWWAKVGVEPVEVANALWRETHRGHGAEPG